MKRNKRYVGLLVVLVVLGFLIGHFGHVYPNGVFVDVPMGHWVGFEIAPTLGPFWDVS
jgi:hypothetical protein